MSDKIIINDMRIFAKHGVFDFEKQNGQEFRIDCVLATDLRCAGVSDDLEKTVNYAEVCELINKITISKSYNLLEALAEKICEEILLTYKSIFSVELTVLKTQAPIDIAHESIGISITRSRHIAHLSIGSNLGDSDSYLNFAITELGKNKHTRVTKVSSFHVTEPYGGVEQPDFLNAALEIETLLTPCELLEFTSSIENSAGRTRDIHWGPRTLDIDIIFYDDVIISEQRLTIPHIEAHKRFFVLEPLCEIAPYKIHPILKKSISQLCEIEETE